MGVTNTPAPGVPRPRPRGWGGGGGRARPPRFAFQVCQSIVDPEIFTPSGEKLDLSAVDPTAERGLHDIENELIFKSNSRFIFHDSPGFESGSVAEMEKVKLFVKQRAETNKLSDQLHAIWYCLPTDTDRPLLDADTDFFNVRGSGKVPVVAIFTKFDGLVTKAFGKLRNNGMSLIDARKRKFELAHEKLNTDFIVPLMSTAFHPSDHVRLNDMRQDSSHCKELIAKTVDVLDEPRLKLLLVSVQQNNIDLSIRYAVQESVLVYWVRNTVQEGLEWFPHTWVSAITRSKWVLAVNDRSICAAIFLSVSLQYVSAISSSSSNCGLG
ncbi:hypothetical protein B0H14DRAFT_2688056 [Mycena olivaceomarginata]|nr:hypothetical protein B0H14DRAFT_2688056 [Mycena olivaceomarginata]